MMTDADSALALRFAATRQFDDKQDWDDVLRRLTPSSSWRKHRFVLIGVAAALLIGSTATFAIGGTIHDLFFGKPAPPIIKRAFVQQNEASRQMRDWQKAHGTPPPVPVPANIDVSKAHGVLAVRTPDGLLMLWAAPAADGAECYFVDFAADQLHHKRPTGGGSCLTGAMPPSKMQWGYGWTIAHPTLKELSGRLYVDAATIVVYAPGSRPRRLPVVDRYFLAAFPRSVKTPTRLAALDKHGHVLARYVAHK
jgi:hypothetical protein